MTPDVLAEVERFLARVASSPRAALLLDYDGTLAPFTVKRDQAFPYAGVPALLQEIIRNGRTRVVVISGRDVTTLPPLLHVQPPPELWGIHGLQRLREDGTPVMPQLETKTLDALGDAVRWLDYQHLRHVAEIKTGTVAVHWRGLTMIEADEIRARVLLGWRLLATHHQLNLLEFDGGIEIRAREANKGDAVRSFLDDFGPDAPVAYLGDDTSDESAFAAIGRRGLTFLVRSQPRQTHAKIWLNPPNDVVVFLELWLNACRQTLTAEAAQSRL